MEGIHVSLQPEIIGNLFGMPVSNSLLLGIIATLLLLGGGVFASRSLRAVPGKLQNGLELIVGGLLDFIESVLGDRKQALQFFPIVAAFFLLILVNNWIGILPGIGSIVIEEAGHATASPLFRSANSDLNTTLALALVSVIAAHLYGMQQLGVLAHLGKFFAFTKGPIYFFVGLLELVGEFAKVLSFSFRLFGNVFAGEVLLITMMTLVPLLAPAPFFALEIFVGFIQALVFSMLTLVFLKISTQTVEH